MRAIALHTAARRGAIACTAGMLLLGSAPALALPIGSRPSDPLTLALSRGERFWGTAPCRGKIAMQSSDAAPAHLEAGIADGALATGAATALMWATWQRTAAGEVRSCSITLNSSKWPTWLWDDQHFQWFCDGITHELGHFLGHRDDGQTDPSSIEYPYISPGLPNYNSVPECRHFTLWSGVRRIAQ